MRTVADRHRLAAYCNKHCWRAFRWYQHRCPWTTLNPQNKGFSDLFAISGCDTFQERIAPKSLKIDQDNLRIKFSQLNVDFSSVSFDP